MLADPEHSHRAAGSRTSVVDLTFALWALLIPVALHGRLLNGDGDLPRHLVIGEHILREGPHFLDVFSFTRSGEPFLAYEWLSQVLFHLAHRVGGLPFVAVLGGLLIASALALVVGYVRRKGGDPWLAYMTGALAAVLSGPHWLARPHLFTLVALPLLLHLLDRKRPAIAALALLFGVWANLHPGFIYGLALLGVVQGGRLAEGLLARERSLPASLATLLPVPVAATASLMNPFGWSLHFHIMDHMGNAEVLGAVEEFRPLDLFSAYGGLVLATTALVSAGLVARQKRPPLDVAGAFVMGLVAAAVARRNGPLLAVAGLPMMVRFLSPVVRGLPDAMAGRMRQEFARSDGHGRRASIAALVALAMIVLVGGGLGGITVIPSRFSHETFPVEAVDRAREVELSGRLLSEYSWGGYVLHAWPAQRIFVDSMADFFGPELLMRYSMMRDGGPEWRSVLDEEDISIVLLRPDAPLVGLLRAERAWLVLHEDTTAVLLVRTTESGERAAT